MESEIARKNQTISDLKQKLQKPTESGDKHENCTEDYLKVRFYFYLYGAFRSAAWQVSAIFLAHFFQKWFVQGHPANFVAEVGPELTP